MSMFMSESMQNGEYVILPPTTKEVQGFDEKPYFSLQALVGGFNHILGQVLTIADASFSDTVQRKAVKDLIKNAVWDTSASYEGMVRRGQPGIIGDQVE